MSLSGYVTGRLGHISRCRVLVGCGRGEWRRNHYSSMPDSGTPTEGVFLALSSIPHKTCGRQHLAREELGMALYRKVSTWRLLYHSDHLFGL